MLFSVAFMWGIAPPIVKPALKYLPPDLFLTYRFFISTLIMVPILLIAEKNLLHQLGKLTSTQWTILIANSLLGSTVQIGLLFWGLSLTTSFEASVITSLSPLFTALAALIFLHEHLTMRKKIGYLLALIGTIFLVVEPLIYGHKLALAPGSLFGNIYVCIYPPSF